MERTEVTKFTQGSTHNREVRDAIRKEVILQTGQVSTTAGLELERGVDFGSNDGLAIDHVDEVLLLDLDLVLKGVEMLDDLGGAEDGRRCGDIVKRCLVGEIRGAGRGQELLVHGSHVV